MPVTRKQKSKADMISDLRNMQAKIGSGPYEREDSEFANSVERPQSPSYNALIHNNSNSHSSSRENEIRVFARKRFRLNRLSRELSQRERETGNEWVDEQC